MHLPCAPQSLRWLVVLAAPLFAATLAVCDLATADPSTSLVETYLNQCADGDRRLLGCPTDDNAGQYDESVDDVIHVDGVNQADSHSVMLDSADTYLLAAEEDPAKGRATAGIVIIQDALHFFVFHPVRR